MSAPRLLDPSSAAAPQRDAADGQGELRQRARDIYLAWLLNLPADVDPSLAATALLARIETSTDAGPVSAEAAHLRALLEETMSWPREVLTTIPPYRPPSGGGQGRERKCAAWRRVRQ